MAKTRIMIKLSNGKYIDMSKAKTIEYDSMEKARPTKYIKRVPKPSGKGYYYFYTREQVKEFQEKGVVPKEEKGGSFWDKVKSFFGNNADEKVNKLHEIVSGAGISVTKDSLAEHLAEYLSNKEKWDAKFRGEKKEKGEAKPKTESAKSEKKESGAKKEGSKWNNNLMKFFSNQYGMIGALKKEEVKKQSQNSESKSESKDNFETMPEGEDIEKGIEDYYKKIVEEFSNEKPDLDKIKKVAKEKANKINSIMNKEISLDTGGIVKSNKKFTLEKYDPKEDKMTFKDNNGKTQEITFSKFEKENPKFFDNQKPSATEALKEELGKKKGESEIEKYISEMMSMYKKQAEEARKQGISQERIDAALKDREKDARDYVKKLKSWTENKDYENLKEILHTGNKSSRKIFEGLSGISLGSTNKSTEQALQDFVGPQKMKEYDEKVKAESEQKAKIEREKKDQEEQAKYGHLGDYAKTLTPKQKGLASKFLKEKFKWGNDGIATRQERIDKLIKDGWSIKSDKYGGYSFQSEDGYFSDQLDKQISLDYAKHELSKLGKFKETEETKYNQEYSKLYQKKQQLEKQIDNLDKGMMTGSIERNKISEKRNEVKDINKKLEEMDKNPPKKEPSEPKKESGSSPEEKQAKESDQKPSATEALKEELGKKKGESKEREITVFGKQQKVKTKPIELNLGYSHPFEIAKRDFGSGRSDWVILESNTGLKVGDGKTQKEAISNAESMIKKYTPTENDFKKLIEKSLSSENVSKREKEIEKNKEIDKKIEKDFEDKSPKGQASIKKMEAEEKKQKEQEKKRQSSDPQERYDAIKQDIEQNKDDLKDLLNYDYITDDGKFYNEEGDDKLTFQEALEDNFNIAGVDIYKKGWESKVAEYNVKDIQEIKDKYDQFQKNQKELKAIKEELLGPKMFKALSNLRHEIMLKAQPTKYIKRIPNPKGKGYIYFYTQQQVKDYEKSGKLPDDQQKKPEVKEKTGKGNIEILKESIKKVASIFADALSAKDAVQPSGFAVEQTGENVAQKSKDKKRLEKQRDIRKTTKKNTPEEKPTK